MRELDPRAVQRRLAGRPIDLADLERLEGDRSISRTSRGSMAAMRELDPPEVERRLAELASAYVAETVEQGRARLRAEAMSAGAFAAGVARRLEELRALDDLTRYSTVPARWYRATSGEAPPQRGRT